MAGFDEQGAPELDEQSDPDTIKTQTTSPGILKILKEFDCNSGVFRDARFFHARFHGIHLTRDTLQEFLRSETTIAKAEKLARITLSFLKDAVRVDEATLSVLERLWTKNESRTVNQPGRNSVFLVKIYFAAYLTMSWEQNFDLVYFALEDSAVEDLHKYANPNNHANITRRWYIHPSRILLMSQDDFLRFPEQLRHHSSRRDMLLAAIDKRSLVIRSGDAHQDQQTKKIHSDLNSETNRIVDAFMSIDVEAQGIRSVLSYYNRFRVGMNQPSQGFLRQSSCDDEQESKRTATRFWHECHGGDQDDFLPVDENVLGLSSRPESVCLYFVDGLGDLTEQATPSPLKMDLLEHSLAMLQNSSVPKWDRGWNLGSRKSASQSFDAEMEGLVLEAIAKCRLVEDMAPKDLGKQRTSLKSDSDRPRMASTSPHRTSVQIGLTSTRGLEDSQGPIHDVDLGLIPEVSTSCEASNTTEIENGTQAAALPDLAYHAVSVQDVGPGLRQRLLFCKVIHEVDCLMRMRRTARESLRAPAAEARARGKRRASSTASSHGEPQESSPSPTSVSDASKRPIDLTEDDDDDDDQPIGTQGPAKRLLVREPASVIQGDRLGDQELEALIRNGYFGATAEAEVEKEEPAINEDQPVMV